jgi:hypothetical protein
MARPLRYTFEVMGTFGETECECEWVEMRSFSSTMLAARD